VSAAASWGTGGLPVSRSNEEERNARACQIWPKIGSRMKKEMATGLGRKTRRVRAIQKIMPVLPYIKLLVVTARTAWFNFRGWKKRL
jgi:hypothetical protein